jgi:hypothetical protein
MGLPSKNIPLEKVNVGMPKADVLKVLGPPFNVVGSKPFPHGTVDVWEYRRYALVVESSNDVLEQYWLYFLDGKLTQWGRPGDWSKEADRVYEVRMR